MNRRNLQRFENLIMITFPIVMFAGCAGSDTKPVIAEKPAVTYATYSNPLPEQEFPEISTAMPLADEIDPAISDDTLPDLSDENVTAKKQHVTGTNDSDIATIQTPNTSILYFETDRFQLRSAQQETLQQYVKFLLANPTITLVINGHADIRGTEQYNQTLSEKRAQSVYDLLVANGVPPGQLTTMGFGELQPLNDENQWNENRRVELEFENPVILSSRQ